MKNALLASTANVDINDAIVSKKSLADRITLSNVRSDVECDTACVAFDVLVDGKVIESTLEWVDEDGDLVRQDCHLDVNHAFVAEAHDIFGEDDDEDFSVLGHVWDLLVVAAEKLRDEAQIRKLYEERARILAEEEAESSRPATAAEVRASIRARGDDVRITRSGEVHYRTGGNGPWLYRGKLDRHVVWTTARGSEVVNT